MKHASLQTRTEHALTEANGASLDCFKSTSFLLPVRPYADGLTDLVGLSPPVWDPDSENNDDDVFVVFKLPSIGGTCVLVVRRVGDAEGIVIPREENTPLPPPPFDLSMSTLFAITPATRCQIPSCRQQAMRVRHCNLERYCNNAAMH